MEKLRRGTEIFVLLLFCMSSVFFVSRVFSYSTNITHPTLIDKMAELYNQNFDPDLTAEQISWMKQGSVDEDMPPRWMNHFFDPVNNKGLRGIYMTAKDWAKDPESQSDYALGDFSWQRAILDYREGNIRHAFLSLGHVLHLLSDINVPAHTRDDIHISGDSYEQFLKVNGVKWNGDSVEFFGDLEDAFVKLANYANNNFYSDSTIESDRYNIIEVHSYETENGFLVAKDHDGRNLYFVNRLSDWNILPGIKSLSANVVLNDYADHLLPQVISSGAGVIDLFFSEVKNGGDFILPAQKNAKEKVSYAFGFLVKKVNELFGKFKEPDKFVVQAGEEPGYALIGKPNNESVQEDDEVIVEQNNQEEPGSGSLPTQEDIEEVSGGLKEIEEVDQEYLEEVVEEEIESNDGPVNFVYPLPLSFEPPNNESVQSGTGTESSVASQENNSSSSVENTQSSSPGGGTVVQGQTEEPQHSIDNSPTSTESLDGQDEESVESENIESSEDLVIDIVSSSIGTYAQILDVVISEVAWAGTASDKSTDEWIELYNNTDEQINLSGWKILVSDRVIELTGTMSSFGYFLLERTDDSALVGVDADQIFTLRGGLKNAGEHLQLIDAGDQIIDKVDCTTGWFSGDAEGYRSMRRVSTTLGGSYPLNWEYGNGQKPHDPSFSYQPPIEEKEEDVVVEEHEEQEPDVGMENPVVDNPPTSTKEYTIEDDQDESEETDSSIDPDSVDNPVGGYSGYQPSFTILTSVQSEKERVLTKDNNPYILQYNYIVPVGKILRIEPGVVVKAYSRDSYFDIRGYMIANGTSSLPITLTSGRDTSFESARLNRVVGTQGTGQAEAGDWQGIKLQPAAQLVLSGVHMRYAGAEFIVGNKKYQHAIKADTADLLIDGSSLVNNGELSILSSFSTTTIKDSVIVGR